MIYNQIKQYELADEIMRAVCDVGGVTFIQLCSAVKTVKLNTLRGLYCLISRDYCIHPDRSARLLCRTRANVINQARKYMQYVQSKDKYTLSIYNQIVKLLKSNKE